MFGVKKDPLVKKTRKSSGSRLPVAPLVKCGESWCSDVYLRASCTVVDVGEDPAVTFRGRRLITKRSALNNARATRPLPRRAARSSFDSVMRPTSHESVWIELYDVFFCGACASLRLRSSLPRRRALSRHALITGSIRVYIYAADLNLVCDGRKRALLFHYHLTCRLFEPFLAGL